MTIKFTVEFTTTNKSTFFWGQYEKATMCSIGIILIVDENRRGRIFIDHGAWYNFLVVVVIVVFIVAIAVSATASECNQIIIFTLHGNESKYSDCWKKIQ